MIFSFPLSRNGPHRRVRHRGLPSVRTEGAEAVVLRGAQGGRGGACAQMHVAPKSPIHPLVASHPAQGASS